MKLCSDLKRPESLLLKALTFVFVFYKQIAEMHRYVLMLKLCLFLLERVFGCLVLFSPALYWRENLLDENCVIQEGICESATKHIFSVRNVSGTRILG